MQYATLNNGVKMPMLGFGVFQVPDLQECETATLTALETGYRLIDTAAVYGNETAVGAAIQKSGIAREEMFITTKLWVSAAGYDAAKAAFQVSLDKLQLDYLDLYLIHQPFGDVHGAWRAMEELYEAGKIKAIGISNFYPDRVMDMIMHNKIVPAVNQIETHPFNAQVEAHAFSQENGVQTQSWGPFMEGKNNIFQNEVLVSVAAKHKRTTAQVMLRWLTQRGIVVIPKSVRKERIEENFNSFGFDLDADDLALIATLDTGKSIFIDHRSPAFVKMLSSRKL